MTAPSENGDGPARCMTMALKDAGINADQVEYLNAHGTSTQMNDYNETLVLKEVFGKRAYDIPISSTKSYTGHLIAAAGAMETIFCLKGLEEKIIPATINLNSHDPKCDLNYVPNEHLFDQNLNHVLNINYGFGGANSCLVLKRFSE